MNEVRTGGEATREVPCDRLEQLGWNQPVVEAPGGAWDRLHVERPVILDGIRDVEVGGLASEAQVLSDARRDWEGLLAGAGRHMGDREVGHPGDLPVTGRWLAHLFQVDDETGPALAGIGWRASVRPGPDEAVMYDEAELRLGKRQASIVHQGVEIVVLGRHAVAGDPLDLGPRHVLLEHG